MAHRAAIVWRRFGSCESSRFADDVCVSASTNRSKQPFVVLAAFVVLFVISGRDGFGGVARVLFLVGFVAMLIGANRRRKVTSIEVVPWNALAEELGFRHRPDDAGRPGRLRGYIGRHKFEIDLPNERQRPKIEVAFESGLRDVELRTLPYSGALSSHRRQVPTGDPEFDARFVVFAGDTTDDESVTSWLDATRRSILVVLDQTFLVREIDEDEFEVELRQRDCSPEEMREAIDLCSLAAAALDVKGVPQDLLESESSPQDVAHGQMDHRDDDGPPVYGRRL